MLFTFLFGNFGKMFLLCFLMYVCSLLLHYMFLYNILYCLFLQVRLMNRLGVCCDLGMVNLGSS